MTPDTDLQQTIAEDETAASARNAGKIPVRNWWHMLLYAWDLVELEGLFDPDWEDAPDLGELLTLILVGLVNRQVRRGLRGDYVDRSEALKTVRGRIDFTQTLSDLLLYKGQLHCEYQEYSINVPRNQIIATTLQRQSRRGIRGYRQDRATALKAKVDRLVRTMDEIDRIGLDLSLFSNEMHKLGPNEREYKLMLLVCEMLYRPGMPLEGDDEVARSFQDWLQKREHEIFERFVANFYKLNLRGKGWDVRAQRKYEWNQQEEARSGDIRLPNMNPDLVLTHETGKIVVLDTKWYKSPVESRWGDDAVHTSNLYQMYAYLASQDHWGGEHLRSTGILLYGQTEIGRRRLRTRIDEHPFRVYTLDLTQDWEGVEGDLVELLNCD